ncbi:hypothetical protein Lesp02_50810 [Lentzea sp. NBRC 105346]|nr:hypothetical protein Lesp02_50810 [Lentzea sp. NBRC 105346]
MSRMQGTLPVFEMAIDSPICEPTANEGAAGTAVTPITSSGHGCGGPGGGGGGGGGVVGVGDGVAVDDEVGGGVVKVDGGVDAAATGVDCATGSSSLIRAPTSHTTAISATTATTMAATRLRQYTADGRGPLGSITRRTYSHRPELSGSPA